MDHHRLSAILPSNDIDAAETWFKRLGFERGQEDRDRVAPGGPDDYRILHDGKGGEIHLTVATKDWLIKGRNPFGIYLYTEDVDAVAEKFKDDILEEGKKAEHKSWNMYEFSLNGPDETLVRIGWPSKHVKKSE